MRPSILYFVATAAVALNLAACSSETEVAGIGIGGSGKTPVASEITSTGTITGFGSIIVNDVRFETSSSTFDVDDNPDSTEDDLAIGMRVTVAGTLNADGVTGNATSVTYDEELSGPVSSVDDKDADNKTITVLGIQAALNRTTTRFDTVKSGPKAFDFNYISQANSVDDVVELSGYVDSNGVLVATRIELEDKKFKIDVSKLELMGIITSVNGNDFTLSLLGISGVTVDVITSNKTKYADIPDGISEGILVEVEGTCPEIACTTIAAKRIEGESEGFESDGEATIQGFITQYTSDSDFYVSGFPVDASSAVFKPETLVLAEDLFVEVEGTVIDGTLVATKVELEQD